MKVTVDCDIRESLDKVSSKMRRDYSESLREINLYTSSATDGSAGTQLQPPIRLRHRIFGAQPLNRKERYAMAHESIQIVQALWGSWGEDAWTRDVEGGQFADMNKIQPVNLKGQYYASRGPLPIPPSEQGQPPILMTSSRLEDREK